jgi:hypothetical protein
MVLMVRVDAQALTPRAKTWAGRLWLLLPQEDAIKAVSLLVAQAYTSVEVLAGVDERALLALPEVHALKPGVTIALSNTLAELKVCWCLCCNRLYHSAYITCVYCA